MTSAVPASGAGDPEVAVAKPAGEPVVPAAGARRRRWWLVPVALVLVVALYVGGTFVQVWKASREDHARRAQAAVVLGAAQYNGRPSPVLQARLDHALGMYREGLVPIIVVTGGRQPGDRYTEATTGYNYLRAQGVPDAKIRKEVQGRTTYESLASVSRFLKKEGIDDVVLVSGPAQAKRIAGIAGAVGLHAAVSSTPGSADRRSLLRETAAVAAGRIVGYRRLERLDR